MREKSPAKPQANARRLSLRSLETSHPLPKHSPLQNPIRRVRCSKFIASNQESNASGNMKQNVNYYCPTPFPLLCFSNAQSLQPTRNGTT
jgi:hypothetical protein